jgi:mono/diheme cytochrome c family protein
VTAKVSTIARLGIMTAGVTIAFAAMAQTAPHPKSHATTTKAAAPAAAAAVTPTPKPGQVVPTTPTAASSGATSMPAGPESEAVVTASADPAKMAKGKELFTNFSCGSCHALSDAGADGHVGPALDGNKGLTEALVKDRVTNGQGPMPAFAGQMTDEEIADVSAYVAHAAKK